jgi:hypothetical protein
MSADQQMIFFMKIPTIKILSKNSGVRTTEKSSKSKLKDAWTNRPTALLSYPKNFPSKQSAGAVENKVLVLDCGNMRRSLAFLSKKSVRERQQQKHFEGSFRQVEMVPDGELVPRRAAQAAKN